MKKDNRGFFLAETIIVLTLVTTVMAFVYPNVAKLYENYKLQVKYYDQPEDIYALKAIYEANKDVIDSKTEDTCNGVNDVKGANKLVYNDILDTSRTSYYIDPNSSFNKLSDITELYLVNYMSSPESADFNFNRYLKRMKKTTNEPSSYRLIGVFGIGANTRYASIKIDNPNPDRACNL